MYFQFYHCTTGHTEPDIAGWFIDSKLKETDKLLDQFNQPPICPALAFYNVQHLFELGKAARSRKGIKSASRVGVAPLRGGAETTIYIKTLFRPEGLNLLLFGSLCVFLKSHLCFSFFPYKISRKQMSWGRWEIKWANKNIFSKAMG